MHKLSAILMAAVMAVSVTACCNSGKTEVKEEENKMIRLNVTVTTDAGNLEEVIAGLNLLAAESRKEAGCIGYEIYQSTINPTQLIIVETWQDQAALDAHGKTPHYTTVLPPLKDKMEMKLDRFDF